MKTEIKARAPVARVPDTPAVQKVVYQSDVKPASTGSYNYITSTEDVKSNLIALDTQLKTASDAAAAQSYSIAAQATPETGFAATYVLQKGGVDVSGSAKINIPKDMVVESGSVVDITFSEGHLYDGATDVTTAIKGTDGTATAADAGKYVKLVIANKTDSALYIKATDLVDVYTGSGSGTDGTQVKVEVTNGVISAHIVQGSIVSTDLANDAVVTAKILDANVTKAKLDSSVQTSLGKADTALQSSSIAEGTTNGTIKVGSTDVAVHGLGSAAYTDSTDYATAAQGGKADTALQPTDVVSTYSSSGTDPVNGTAIAAAISGLDSEETSSDGVNFQVKVEMRDGAIANVNVIHDDTAARDHSHSHSEINDWSEALSDYATADHKHVLDDITDAGDAAALNVGTSSGTVAAGDHTHGNITTDGKVGSTANLAVVTTTDGAITTADLTTAAPTTGSTATVEFVASVSQDSKGKITATKEAVRAASAAAPGLMSASDFSKLAAFGDASTYKTKQTAITTDPTASGTASEVVTSVLQNENGEVTVTRATLPAAVKPDWNAASGAAAEILNKPTLGNVAATNADTNTLAISNGTLKVADGGVGTTQLASGVVTSLGKADTALQPTNVDNTTIEVASSNLQVKNGGITTAKIADANVTTDKLATLTSFKIKDSTTKTESDYYNQVYTVTIDEGVLTVTPVAS